MKNTEFILSIAKFHLLKYILKVMWMKLSKLLSSHDLPCWESRATTFKRVTKGDKFVHARCEPEKRTFYCNLFRALKRFGTGAESNKGYPLMKWYDDGRRSFSGVTLLWPNSTPDGDTLSVFVRQNV
jgi:hypothetical protein